MIIYPPNVPEPHSFTQFDARIAIIYDIYCSLVMIHNWRLETQSRRWLLLPLFPCFFSSVEVFNMDRVRRMLGWDSALKAKLSLCYRAQRALDQGCILSCQKWEDVQKDGRMNERWRRSILDGISDMLTIPSHWIVESSSVKRGLQSQYSNRLRRNLFVKWTNVFWNKVRKLVSAIFRKVELGSRYSHRLHTITTSLFSTGQYRLEKKSMTPFFYVTLRRGGSW